MSKRIYDDSIDWSVIAPRPISLSPREAGVEGKVDEVAEPPDVVAWVRFPETPIRVRAKAVAWTRRAVWVEFTLRDGSTRRAWVWASAVSRPGEEVRRRQSRRGAERL